MTADTREAAQNRRWRTFSKKSTDGSGKGLKRRRTRRREYPTNWDFAFTATLIAINTWTWITIAGFLQGWAAAFTIVWTAVLIGELLIRREAKQRRARIEAASREMAGIEQHFRNLGDAIGKIGRAS